MPLLWYVSRNNISSLLVPTPTHLSASPKPRQSLPSLSLILFLLTYKVGSKRDKKEWRYARDAITSADTFSSSLRTVILVVTPDFDE